MSSPLNIHNIVPSSIETKATKVLGDLRRSESNQDPKKAQNAAREFEAVLLGQWLEQAQKSFGTVPGGNDNNNDEDSDPTKEQYQSLALQAVATSLCRSGKGLGIASMVAKHLTHKSEGETGDVKPLQQRDLHIGQRESHGELPRHDETKDTSESFTKVFVRNDR